MFLWDFKRLESRGYTRNFVFTRSSTLVRDKCIHSAISVVTINVLPKRSQILNESTQEVTQRVQNFPMKRLILFFIITVKVSRQLKQERGQTNPRGQD